MPAEVASSPVALQLQQERFLPRHQFHANSPVSVPYWDEERTLKNEAASMKAAGEGFLGPFWKAENRKHLIKL